MSEDTVEDYIAYAHSLSEHWSHALSGWARALIENRKLRAEIERLKKTQLDGQEEKR